jgi:uncharacterized protein (TIGR03437 family)
MLKNTLSTLIALLWLFACASQAQTPVSDAPNSWTMGTPMPTARTGPFTGAIGSKIYVVGGETPSSIVNVNEIYDTATNTWSTGASMPTARYIGASAVVGNVLYAIGGANNGQLNVVEAYDPATDTWSTKAPVPMIVNSVYAAVLNNIIDLVGGYNGAGGRLTTLLSYNPATNVWSTLAPLAVGKSLAAVGLVGSTIISAGGLANSGLVTTDTEGYNAATNSWTELPPMPTARQGSCFGVAGGLFYVAGGGTSGTEAVTNVLEAYNPATNSWTSGLPPIPTPVGAPGSAVVGGSLYCFGGGSDLGIVNYVQIYQPPAAPPAITPGGVVSASGFGGFPSVAPGSWIEIYGSNLAAGTRGWAASDFNGINAPTSLDGTFVTIGGQSAFVDYISPGQVNALVPSNVSLGSQQITITNAQGTSAAFNVTVNSAQPGLLGPSSFNIGGVQYAVGILSDGSYALPVGAIAGVNSRPASPGDVLTLYGVGFGPVTPASPAGQLVQQLNSLSLPLLMSIGGIPVTPSYAGLAPYYTGLYQFNVTVPSLPSGNATLTFSLGGTAGTQKLFLAVGN